MIGNLKHFAYCSSIENEIHERGVSFIGNRQIRHMKEEVVKINDILFF